jgi:hypothetical protein
MMPMPRERRPTRNSSVRSPCKDTVARWEYPRIGLGQILRHLVLKLAFREMDDNPDGLVGAQFARPAER